MLQGSEDNDAEEEFPSFAPGMPGTQIQKEKIPTPTSISPPHSPSIDTMKVSNVPSNETAPVNPVRQKLFSSSISSILSRDIILQVHDANVPSTDTAVVQPAQSRATQLASWLKVTLV